MNQSDGWGHRSGVEVGAAFGDRRAVKCVGLHKETMKGIACGKHGGVSFAQAIVLSGGYCKDVDDGGETIHYTGDGGNDTLGTKEQIRDQGAARAT